MIGRQRRRPAESAWPVPLLLWFGSVLLFGVIGVVLAGREYREFMDCSNPELHESANTAYGWTLALLASLVPVGTASGLAQRLTDRDGRRLMVLAAAVAAGSLLVWWWALDKDCEWHAIGSFSLA